MALETLAKALKADYGSMAGGGELLEYTAPRAPDMIAADAAADALERLTGHKLPAGAFYSARVNVAPHPDDAANYKSMNGLSMVPTDAYTRGQTFATRLMTLADDIEAKQRVLSITIRIGIPPKGFMAMHGDGIIAGPRVALQRGQVWREGRRGATRAPLHARSWLRPIEPKPTHPKSWLKKEKGPL